MSPSSSQQRGEVLLAVLTQGGTNEDKALVTVV